MAGAAVDLTLVDVARRRARPGYADRRDPRAVRRRAATSRPRASAPIARAAPASCSSRVLGGAGLVNYPTEWWHWSYGDRYWALATGAPGALYGPVERRRESRRDRARATRGASARRPGRRSRSTWTRSPRTPELLAAPGDRCADGRGQGRRLRPRGRRRRPYRPRPRRHPARRHQPRRGARPARGRAARPGAQLAQPGRRRLPRRRWLPTSSSPCRAEAHLRGGRARRPGRRHAAGCTCTWTPGWPATAPPPRSGTGCAGPPGGRAAGPGAGGRGDGPPRLRRRPGDPANADGAGSVRLGARDRPGRGPAAAQRHLAATAATLTDPPRHHTMSRVGAGLVGHRPVRHAPRCAPALTLTAPLVARPAGARRHAGRLRPHLDGRRTPTDARRCCPLGYADGLPRAASGRAEVLVARPAPPGGRPDLDGQVVVDLGDDRADLGDGRHRLRSRPIRRADRRRVGRPGPTPSSTRSSPASALGWPGHDVSVMSRSVAGSGSP